MFGQPNMTCLLNELHESSPKDSSIGWESRFMKRRSLIRILIFLPLCGHVKTKNKNKKTRTKKKKSRKKGKKYRLTKKKKN